MNNCTIILIDGFVLGLISILIGALLFVAQARGRAKFRTSVRGAIVAYQGAVWFIPIAVGLALFIIAFVLAAPFCGFGM
jgi:hypothetical protein